MSNGAADPAKVKPKPTKNLDVDFMSPAVTQQYAWKQDLAPMNIPKE
jgi:hypothetical protein